MSNTLKCFPTVGSCKLIQQKLTIKQVVEPFAHISQWQKAGVKKLQWMLQCVCVRVWASWCHWLDFLVSGNSVHRQTARPQQPQLTALICFDRGSITTALHAVLQLRAGAEACPSLLVIYRDHWLLLSLCHFLIPYSFICPTCSYFIRWPQSYVFLTMPLLPILSSAVHLLQFE